MSISPSKQYPTRTLPQQDPHTLISNIKNLYTPPFEIRVPSSEIQFLLNEVNCLKAKY